MTKPITKICIDCKSRLKNRGKATKRCWSCMLEFKRKNAMGRATGNCQDCGKKLSVKVTLSGLCGVCVRKLPGNMRNTGKTAWNKGISKYANQEHEKETRRAIRNERRRNASGGDVLSERIRTLIRNSLRKVSLRKNSKTAVFLGCSTSEFKEYLESLLSDGMTWGNYGNGPGRWNIDHITPISAYDLTKADHQLSAFHFSNCRPMWAIDNIKKSNKFDGIINLI